jgi:MFS transporter, SHS family, lactate transporter
VPPVISYFVVSYNLSFAVPMLIGTVVAATSVVIALLISPETKGQELTSNLVVA